MTLLGHVASLWRYPVKSMAGQECRELHFGFAGVFGDRCWALHDAAARRGMPYLTATAFERLLCYQPSFRFPERAALPPNLSEAASMAPGLTVANASAAELAVDVVAPTGERFALEDPRFLQHLAATLDPETAAHDPAILRYVAQHHDACAGVYAAVLVEGVVRQGDPITLLD